MLDTLQPIDLTNNPLTQETVDAEFEIIAKYLEDEGVDLNPYPLLAIDTIVATSQQCEQAILTLASDRVKNDQTQFVNSEQLILLNGAHYFSKQYRNALVQIDSNNTDTATASGLILPSKYEKKISRYDTNGPSELDLDTVVDQIRGIEGFQPEGKTVEIIEDLIDEAKTLETVCKALGILGVNDIIITVFARKPDVDNQVDLSALENVSSIREGLLLPNKWLVGAGMNADRKPYPELYRKLRLIGALPPL